MTMQDPVKTIKELLYDDWFDDGSVLNRDDITWRFGPPKNPANRFNDAEMSFEFNDLAEPRRKRTQARTQARRAVTVDFWMQANPDAERETLKTNMQTMVDKVDALIAAAETSATDLDFIYVGAGPRNLDRVDEGYVRSQMEIICVHQK